MTENMKIKIKLFSGDKQNFQTKGCFSKGIIEMRESIKLILDEINSDSS